MLIAEIQNIPHKKLVLVTGSPGAGKSTLSQQIALQNIASGLQVIYVITESTSDDLVHKLRDRGLGETRPDSLTIVDAYTQTVGLACSSQKTTVCAHCADLNSMSMAVTKLRRRLNGQDVLLVFDSLTSPYLFNGLNVVKFIQQFLAKFAEEGNRVLVTMDEGCGKEEDLGAMMSVADGIVRLKMGKSDQSIQVVKHPDIPPSTFDKPIPKKFEMETALDEIMDPDFLNLYMKSMFRGKTCFRFRLGDYVNAFWPKLAYWSAMFWDPDGFPLIIYDDTREDQSATGSDAFISFIPQPYKTALRLLNFLRKIGVVPKDFNTPKDISMIWRLLGFPYGAGARLERYGRIEYLPDKSKINEYHYRIFENSDCWDLDNIGSTIASYLPPAMAGQLMGLESKKRMWNAIETKCIGLGDPYCEVKIIPGPSNEVQDHLKRDSETVSRIHNHLIEKYISHITENLTLTDRPEIGPNIHLQIPFHSFGFAHIAGDRSRMALRMGGVKSGKELAERLLVAGLQPDEVIDRVFESFKTLKMGIVTKAGNRITIEENIEPMRTWYMTRLRELTCHFTTGFLNGLFKATYDLRINETKCLAAGHPHCEWEII
jgi:KaiC/GvpD/RAD55 family RecA-like ATPase/predicted hydrocarbon binding protein